MSAESPQPENNEPFITRRALLNSTLAALSIYFVGSDADQSEHLPTNNLDQIVPLQNAPVTIESASTEFLDPDYLGQLFEKLQQETGDAWSRFKTTKEHLRRVQVFAPSNGDVGTALQIDESGIYLTAKHVVWDHDHPTRPNPYFASVTNPYTGESHSVTDYALHPSADIALISAPTGQPRKPVAGIQIGFRDLQQNERLTMASLFPTQDNASNLIIEEGLVDRTFVLPDLKNPDQTLLAESKSSLSVKGLVPFHGASGGPVVDNRGIVVGTAAAGYSHPTGHGFTGAVMTPLTYARGILK